MNKSPYSSEDETENDFSKWRVKNEFIPQPKTEKRPELTIWEKDLWPYCKRILVIQGMLGTLYSWGTQSNYNICQKNKQKYN
jgi:hypothetical protein